MLPPTYGSQTLVAEGYFTVAYLHLKNSDLKQNKQKPNQNQTNNRLRKTQEKKQPPGHISVAHA